MAYVPMANEQTAPGVLDHIEYQAKALVDTVRIQENEITIQRQRTAGLQEEARRDEAGAEEESRRASSPGDAEREVYLSVGLEAFCGPLAKMGKDGFDFFSDMDPAKGVTIDGRKIGTFEDMIKKGANRAPGVYSDKPGTATDGSITLAEKANLAGDSITSQGDCNLRTWGIKTADMPSTELQQNMVFGKQLASEAALASVYRARQIQGPSMGMGGAAAMRSGANLTIDLSSGPKFSLADSDADAVA